MDQYTQMILDLRIATVRAILDGLANDPTPGWAQVARGILTDNKDILNVENDDVDEETLKALEEINLRLTGTDD